MFERGITMRLYFKMHFVLILFILAIVSCSKNGEEDVKASAKVNFTEKEAIVNAHVCMFYDVNLKKKSAYPVYINDRVYYGCCDYSQSELYKDSSKHVSIDPISKDTVDKTEAIIFPDPHRQKDDGVLYFKSKENYLKYITNKGA